MAALNDAIVGSGAYEQRRFVGNEELDRAEAEAEEAQNQPVVLNLAAHLDRLWTAAKGAKTRVEKEMLMDYRQRAGIYEADELVRIRKSGGSEIYMMLTSIKCAALEAWLCDVMLPDDDRNWAAEPTPVADLPEDRKQAIMAQVMMEAQAALMAGAPGIDMGVARARAEQVRDEIIKQIEKEAKAIAERMEQQIDDDLTEGGFDNALREAISDIAVTKAGIVMGPVFRKKRKLEWKQTPDGYQPVQGEKIVKEYMRRSPFDIYPGPDATTLQDSYLFDIHRLEPIDLLSMKGVPGFDSAAIDAVLLRHSTGGLKEWLGIDQSRREIEQRQDEMSTGGESRKIAALCYWGNVPGRLLIEWAENRPESAFVGANNLDPMMEYAVNAWKVGTYVVGVALNGTPLGKRPYAKASFREAPGSFWGEGLAHEIRDCQNMCNAAARAISNNMGISSGPQVIINDVNRIPSNETVTNLYPWKIHQFLGDKTGSSHRPPIEFFQPASISTELMAIFEKFSQIADEVSNVPAYTYGDANLGGAAKTASGLSMLITQASKGIKHIVKSIDKGVIEPVVWLTYAYNMLYNEDESIKGDVEIRARGAVSLIAKEQQQIRRAEFLQMTANPIDMQIMGLPGRAALLRENVKSLEMPTDEVVPDPAGLDAAADQGRVMMLLQNIAANLGVPIEQLAQAAQQPPQQAQGPQQGPQQGRTLDNAGQPVAGQDTRSFNA